MSQAFNCPKCGAPLDYDGGPDLTITCAHCKNSVIVPEELRVGPPSASSGFSDLAQLAAQSSRLGEMADMVRAGKKIEAIKIYREVFGVGLKEAKDAVEALAAGKPVQVGGATVVTTRFDATPQVVVKSGRNLGCIIAAIVTAIVALVIVPALIVPAGMFIALNPFAPTPTRTVTPTRTATATPIPTATRVPTTTPTPAFMNLALKFGGSGSGPGLFTDARSIAVDGEGNIYVGEYTGGRIQVFDSAGKFSTQWTVDAQAPLRWLASDRKGTVYIAQKGILAKFEGATGKSLGQVQFPDNRFDQVITLPDGGLLALWFEARTGLFTSVQGVRDDLVRFDREGKVVKTIPGFISSLTNRPEFDAKLTVDGAGNIFALASSTIFKFTPDGKYENKFGSRGNEPGQFRSPQAIAIDNQSRIYVADSNAVLVFALDGRYLDTFRVEGGSPSGMVFNDKNELFVVARTQVFKYVLSKP
ncbi:MAG: ribosomal protein L7/L12 [Chloroflexi bacterium]|nr:ribosomal protein L7/L12 [Chloroflexota bacterium]